MGLDEQKNCKHKIKTDIEPRNKKLTVEKWEYIF